MSERQLLINDTEYGVEKLSVERKKVNNITHYHNFVCVSLFRFFERKNTYQYVIDRAIELKKLF